jgi:hypothetical protein
VVRANQVLTVVVAFTVGHVASEVGDSERPSAQELQAFHRPRPRPVPPRGPTGPPWAPSTATPSSPRLDFIVDGVERLVRSAVGAR